MQLQILNILEQFQMQNLYKAFKLIASQMHSRFQKAKFITVCTHFSLI